MNAKAIIEVAEKEIGNKENPADSNHTKYGEWFGFDGVAWCAMFVSWCYYHAGLPIKGMGWPKGFAGCQAGVSYLKKNNLITNDPQPGDIVFFDWNNDKRWDHTGIFIRKISDTHFETIEGNTSATNQSNGGEVQRRTRKYGSGVLFAHLKF